MTTENVLGYCIYARGKKACIDDITKWIQDKPSQARWLACINPHSYVLARNDLPFFNALRNANWLIPDGVGIVLASRFIGGCINERITGSDIFKSIMSHLDQVGGSVFFLGSTNETLMALCSKVRDDFPSVRIAGTHSPPFKPVFTEAEIDKMVSEINAVEPDVLWVGMTSPKQDVWIFSNISMLRVRFAAGVGAVFDFYTGRVKRSHPIFQQIGLEWLPRLLQQPQRLWRRMFVSAPIFVWDVIKERFR